MFFVPKFEEVYKKALDEYEQIKFESETYPQEFLTKFKPEKKEVKNGKEL